MFDQVAVGQSDSEIAARLDISPTTVRLHVARVMAELGVSTRAELTPRPTARAELAEQSAEGGSARGRGVGAGVEWWWRLRRRSKVAVVGVLAVVGFLLAIFVTADDARGGRIVFSSGRDIYTVNGDGSGLTRITSTLHTDRNPVWSPDGNRIAYMSDRDGPSVYVMQADGAEPTRVADAISVGSRQPTWSPDGSLIALQEDGDHYAIHHADGSGPRQVSDGEGSGLSPPAWSPDGSRFAFGSPSGLRVTRQDGGEEVFLTRAPAFQPVWSPDGSLIAFMGLVTDGRDVDGSLEVYVIRADGTGLTRLTHRPINTASELRRTSDLAWSPDGRRIAFAAWWDGNAEIYVVDSDGSELTRLTERQANDRSPRWSADGRRIAFAASNPSGASRRAGLYAISAQGTGLTRLSRAPVDWPISWSP